MSTYQPNDADQDVLLVTQRLDGDARAAFDRIMKRAAQARIAWIKEVNAMGATLSKIRATGGGQIIATSAEGHSHCIHLADAALRSRRSIHESS